MPPATATTGDPRPGRRAAARQRLLEAGLSLMAQKGVQACKVEEITAQAGVAKGTFFTHFASKEVFVAQLVESVLDDLSRRVRPLGLAPGEPESLLGAVGSVYLRYFQLRPTAAALLVQAAGLDPDGPAGGAIRGRLADHLEALATMLSPAAAHLGWPAEHGRELALSLLATATGFFWYGPRLGLAQEMPLNLMDRLGRMLARGLVTREGGERGGR